MKILLLLAAPAFAQGAAPTPPPTEVIESAPSAPAAAAAEPAKAAEAAKPAAPAKADDKKAEESKVTVETPKVEETKPLPPEPKKEEPKPAAPKAAAKADSAVEFAFVKSASEDSDGDAQDAAAEVARGFVRRWPSAPQTPDALGIWATLLQKRNDWQTALAVDLRLVHEFPDSGATLGAKSSYLDLVQKKASRRLRGPLSELAKGTDGADAGARLSALWQALADKAPDAIYEPAVEQVRDAFARFPDLKDADRLQAALARLHAANGKTQAALVAWRQLLALYPDSDLRPRAQKSIGDLYADSVRDYKKAIEAYQRVVADYPKSPEVADALLRSAQIFDDRLKQYGLSIEMYEKIVALFPKTPSSLKALQEIARLQRSTEKPDEAIKTLQRLSTMHGGQDGVDALLLAATIARRDLKDYKREASLREQVAADYATAKEAPQALYDAAGVYEDDLKDLPKAIETYRAVAAKFAGSRLAKKAYDRGDKLSAKP